MSCPVSSNVTTWSDAFINNVLYSPTSPVNTTTKNTFTLADFKCPDIYTPGSSLPLSMVVTTPQVPSIVTSGTPTLYWTPSGLVDPLSVPSITNASGNMTCPPGSSSLDGISNCKKCSIGSYSQASGAKYCVACGPGSFQNTFGATSCKTTLAGTIGNATPNTGSGYVKICPSDTFATAAWSQASCQLYAYTSNSQSILTGLPAPPNPNTGVAYAPSYSVPTLSAITGNCNITPANTPTSALDCTIKKRINLINPDTFNKDPFGTISTAGSYANKLTKIDLSDNKLSRPLHPLTFSALPNLKVLNLTNTTPPYTTTRVRDLEFRTKALVVGIPY